jgi:hypothetical protein
MSSSSAALQGQRRAAAPARLDFPRVAVDVRSTCPALLVAGPPTAHPSPGPDSGRAWCPTCWRIRRYCRSSRGDWFYDHGGRRRAGLRRYLGPAWLGIRASRSTSTTGPAASFAAVSRTWPGVWHQAVVARRVDGRRTVVGAFSTANERPVVLTAIVGAERGRRYGRGSPVKGVRRSEGAIGDQA